MKKENDENELKKELETSSGEEELEKISWRIRDFTFSPAAYFQSD